MENAGVKMQISYAGTLIFSFLSNENRITGCSCSPAPERFGLYSQDYNAKEGRTDGLRIFSLLSGFFQTCWGYVCSKCLAQVWAQSMFMHYLFGQLKSLAGLWHPLGQVWDPPRLEQWGKAHQAGARAGAGAGGPCRGHMPGIGLLLLLLWCQPERYFFCLPVVWSQNQSLPVEKQVPWHHLSPLTTSQVCPGAHPVGFGREQHSRMRCSWGQAELLAGLWHRLHQLCSAEPLQSQMWWLKAAVAKVSLTLYWKEVGERTSTAGSEVCPDQQRQVRCLWQKPEA